MALFQRIKAPFIEREPEPEARLASGPRTAGDILRQRREALGLDLDQCARALKIKPSFLYALEEGQPDQLPGAPYAIGFVRAYGDYLGLDSDHLLRRFKAESAALAARPDLTFPMPLGERSLPGAGMLLVALILVICGYGGWYYLSTAQRARPQRIAEVPLALLAPKPEPAPAETPNRANPEAPPGAAAANPPAPPPTQAAPTTAPAAPAPADSAAAARTVPSPAAATKTAPPADQPARDAGSAAAPAAVPPVADTSAAAATPNPPVAATTAPSPSPAAAAAAPAPDTGAGHSYGVADRPVRIVIHATADSWIQVSDADEGTVFTRTLKAGDSYRVPDRPGLLLRTGNAGGLDIQVDGRPAPPLGKSGMVRRDVALEPQALAGGPTAHD